MKHIFVVFLFVFPLFGIAQSNDSVRISEGFSVSANYIGDYLYNTLGGIKKGGAYMGLAAMEVNFSSNDAGIWKGGNFYVKGHAVHGKSLSENYVGDFQIVSNIDGGEHTYLHEFWYSQEIRKTKFTIGLQDINVEFAVSDVGSNFINSSFGIPSVISDNVPCALFPLTTVGLTYVILFNNQKLLSFAVYDGNPTHFDINPYNTDWKLKKSDGILSIIEYKATIKDRITYKLGFYNHSGLRITNEITNTEEEVFDSNYGAYSIIDVNIFKNNNKKIDAFMQLMKSPKEINNHDVFIGTGIIVSGFGYETSKIGLALAHAGFHNSENISETAIELTYSIELIENIHVQPDMQYIINPLGTGTILKDAFVAGLRLQLEI